MARRKSCEGKPAVRRKSWNSTDNVATPMQKRRRVSSEQTPLMHKSPVSNINVTAEKGSSVSFLNLSSNNINGNVSNKHTAPSFDSQKKKELRLRQSVQQKICKYNTRQSSTGSHLNAQVKSTPVKPRRALFPSSENKENCITVAEAKIAHEHQKATLSGQIVEHPEYGPLNHLYKLRDATGSIVLFANDRKLRCGGWYSLTELAAQSQTVLIVTPNTTITPITPLKHMRPVCKEVVNGSIITAKVSAKYICIRGECKTELPAPLNNEDHVRCQKCSHSVLYSEMPRFATAEITLKTDQKSDSAFVLSHAHLCHLVPVGEKGVIDIKDIEGQLLKWNIYLSVEGKEVIGVSDTP